MGEKGRVFTGARARFMLNGAKVGYATGCDGREEIRYEPVRVLGNLQVQEHVPVAYDVSFSARFVRLVGETLKSRGYFPKLGSNPDDFVKNVLLAGDLTVTLEDVITGQVITTVEQVRAASNNWSIDAQGVVGTNMEFVAVRMRDESEV